MTQVEKSSCWKKINYNKERPGEKDTQRERERERERELKVDGLL